MRNIKKKMAHAQKIQTIKHKYWLISGFYILKALSSIVIDILQEKLKMEIIEPCHSSYKNL